MSNSNRKLKAVSFNIEDEYEEKLLEHVNSIKNFSGYVKRLINDDMRGLGQNILQFVPNKDEIRDEYSNEDKEAMSSFF